MVLEIINSCLCSNILHNPNLVYSLLYQKELFTMFRTHPTFQDIIQNIDTVRNTLYFDIYIFKIHAFKKNHCSTKPHITNLFFFFFFFIKTFLFLRLFCLHLILLDNFSFCENHFSLHFPSGLLYSICQKLFTEISTFFWDFCFIFMLFLFFIFFNVIHLN